MAARLPSHPWVGYVPIVEPLSGVAVKFCWYVRPRAASMVFTAYPLSRVRRVRRDYSQLANAERTRFASDASNEAEQPSGYHRVHKCLVIVRIKWVKARALQSCFYCPPPAGRLPLTQDTHHEHRRSIVIHEAIA